MYSSILLLAFLIFSFSVIFTPTLIITILRIGIRQFFYSAVRSMPKETLTLVFVLAFHTIHPGTI